MVYELLISHRASFSWESYASLKSAAFPYLQPSACAKTPFPPDCCSIPGDTRASKGLVPIGRRRRSLWKKITLVAPEL